jgi:hypothetical protein
LKSYELSFRKNLQKKPIYFNYKTDDLYMIDVYALQSFMRFWVEDSPTGYRVAKAKKLSNSKIGTIIVRSGLYMAVPLHLFRRYGVAVFIVELHQPTNLQNVEEACRLFDQSWTAGFGKDSERRPKILFRTRGD